MKRAENVRKVVVILLAAMYMGLVFGNGFISTFNISFTLAGIHFATMSICGIVTSLNCLVATIIMIVDSRNGYKVVSIIFIAHICYMFIPIIESHDTSTITGVFVVVSYFITITVIHYYTHQMERGQKELKTLVCTDSLTGLPNRLAFMNYIKKMINSQVEFALVYIDVDDFKSINDVRGHNVGDLILCKLADKWGESIRRDIYLARLGGDEFAMVIPKSTSKERIFTRISSMQKYFEQQFEIEGYEFSVTSCIGVACFPEDALDANTLLGCADAAMYQAKREGRYRTSLYNENLTTQLADQVSMEAIIRNAIKTKRVFMVYQPQYSTQDKKLRGYEALVRIRDEEGNVIPPGKFIPIAEKSELILEIEKCVIPLVLNDMKKLWAKSEDKPMISINISAKHLFAPDFLNELKKHIIRANIPNNLIEIEVTETVGIGSIDKAIRILSDLRHLGLSIALDDFGTGYASMSYLSQLPFELLKIDKSFIDAIQNNHHGSNFVKTIVSIGHVLEIPVSAEGVETPEQLDVLKDMECDYIQGYCWGHPEPIDYYLT